MKRWPLVLSIILILLGVIGLIVINFFYFRPFSIRRGGYRRAPGYLSRDFKTNGEQIYFTGISRRGSVSFSGGPVWFQMHGGGCVDCHGVNGKGGRIITMMGNFTAHDIRYKTLVNEDPPFNIKSIKRAITKGIDQKDKRLDPNMPKWNMSDEDLNDVIKFLKTL